MRCSYLLLLAVSPSPCSLVAQTQYQDPPPAIARILDAPLTPVASVSPDRKWLLLIERPSLPSIEEVAAPDLKLAGVRINPLTNGSSRAFTATGLVLREVNGNAERRIAAPVAARLGDIMWSPAGDRVAFTVTRAEGIELWVADVPTGAARRLTGGSLNGTFGNPCQWEPDATGLVCAFRVAGRGAPPAATIVPTGPVIQESEGRSAPNRTYQDLLKDPTDEKLFEYYFTSELHRVALDGASDAIGRPGIHSVVNISPDGRHLLVTTVHRPFSYLVPYNRFPSRIAVWDRTGRVLKQIADVPLQEEVPPSFDAVTTGPRQVRWRADDPATLVWVEALDGGNPAAPAKARDEVRMLPAPFSGSPSVLADLEYRLSRIEWGRADLAVVSEGWSKTRRTRSWAVNPSARGTAPRLLFDRSAEDSYGDPGSFLTTMAGGRETLLFSADGKTVYLAGDGASSEGDRPFLDAYDLAGGKSTRLWRSEAPYYEEVVALLDPARGLMLTQRESAQDPPNYFVRDLKTKRLVQLTRMADPAPAFAGVTKQLITYPRADGVQLSATLYLPPGYTPAQGRLPFLFWAYPREFKTAAAAAQVIGSPYRFTRPSGGSHLFFALVGYGVLDGPTMPIVGEGDKEPNDTYVEQLVASAKAAVDKVVAMGVADRDRIGIGGHSYGAFMTANLLAHSDLFKAGIARSGAYNRTLTPFGFQVEERTYWESPEIYYRMSPFTYANKIKAPLLMIHGMADDNSGTFPVQSERMYAAIKGNGGKVRLVMLPAEAHGYRARQSIGHTLAESLTWLDKYVKGARSSGLTP